MIRNTASRKEHAKVSSKRRTSRRGRNHKRSRSGFVGLGSLYGCSYAVETHYYIDIERQYNNNAIIDDAFNNKGCTFMQSFCTLRFSTYGARVAAADAQNPPAARLTGLVSTRLLSVQSTQTSCDHSSHKSLQNAKTEIHLQVQNIVKRRPWTTSHCQEAVAKVCTLRHQRLPTADSGSWYRRRWLTP